MSSDFFQACINDPHRKTRACRERRSMAEAACSQPPRHRAATGCGPALGPKAPTSAKGPRERCAGRNTPLRPPDCPPPWYPRRHHRRGGTNESELQGSTNALVQCVRRICYGKRCRKTRASESPGGPPHTPREGRRRRIIEPVQNTQVSASRTSRVEPFLNLTFSTPPRVRHMIVEGDPVCRQPAPQPSPS